ncbi:hypothetical protein CDL12_18776 [Handroanthus impetiginosus]|uniref:Uncharacterized protein n=1 Tax=Handroanthus impetiginosus TaxID=429701 RepID=A0A2G9GTQ8_9LAMI|nr:hypothetical protein CDL12_18776 [Handroanthus impetiginosus]
MAGMLPGVEAARRRRFHQTGLTNGGAASTRSSFSLYAANFYTSSVEKNPLRQVESDDDEELDAVAREAKKRLDHKLSRSIGNVKSRGEKIYVFKDMLLCSFGNNKS